MNLGVITKPNSKGQIVIPKKYRDMLGVNEKVYLNITIRDTGFYIQPLGNVLINKRDKSFLKVLEETRGAWAGDDWPETEKRRRKIELEASRKRKNAW